MTGAKFVATAMRAVVCLSVQIGAMPGFAFALTPDEKSTADTGKAVECLTSPKGTAPSGERWYYRVERGTKRHCWYSRTEIQRKTVAKISRATEPLKAPDTSEPLQLSVANARAEADLSVQPQPDSRTAQLDVSRPQEPEHPAWTLAGRWAEHMDPPQPVLSPPKQVTPPQPDVEPEPANDGADDLMLIDIVAGIVGLVGLATALIAFLIRRRKQDESATDWHFAQRSMDGVRPRVPLTDLSNDTPANRVRKLREAAQRADENDYVMPRTTQPRR